MQCRECSELLTAYIDRELPEPEAVAVNDHLSRCSDCSRQADSLVLVTTATGSLPAIEPSTGLWYRIHAEIAEEEKSRPLRNRWPMWLPRPWAVAVTAIASLILVLGITIWPASHPLEGRFTRFVEKRERAFQEQREILFRREWSDRYRQVRNPFSQPLTLVDYNPFQE